MAKNPRNYPDTMPGPETGRPMTRGEKLVTFKVKGQIFSYNQPGWWCSLTDPDDTEGQLVDGDNQIAEMARRTAKVLVEKDERVFVPVVIRAIRQHLALTQREAGSVFGTGDKSFEKYESGEIVPSEPTKRLLRLALANPELFKPTNKRADDSAFVHEALRSAQVDGIYEQLFVVP